MLLHAGVTYAQEKLRISFSNVSLEEALKKIESASKYTFFYDDKRTDLSQKVSANAWSKYRGGPQCYVKNHKSHLRDR